LAQYLELFASDVVYLAQQAKKMGYEVDELEDSFRLPSFWHDLEQVSIRLGVIARRIEQDIT
jgi:hypothetical protein